MDISTAGCQELLANVKVRIRNSCFITSYPEKPCHSLSMNAVATVSKDMYNNEDLGEDEPTREQITKDAIIHAIFHALDYIYREMPDGSRDNFAGILAMARILDCKGEQTLIVKKEKKNYLIQMIKKLLKSGPKAGVMQGKFFADVGSTVRRGTLLA